MRLHHTLAIASLCNLTTSLAQAQTQTDTSKLETIVVTAQKRSQSAQKVPMTISALDAKKLKQLGLTSSNQISNYISNVQIGLPSGTGNQPDITIRGVGLNDYNSNNAGPNAVYVDDVYMSAPASQTFQTFDLSRIEVLKGPQGTLYGRNANGGAINYVSAKPTDDFFASEDLTYGSYNTLSSESVLNGPITDHVDGRLAVSHNYSDGYFDNLQDGKTTNGENDYAWRAQLAIRPTDNLDIDLNFHGGIVDRRPDEYHQLGTLDSAFGAPCNTAAVLAGSCVDLYGYKSPTDLYSGNYNRDQKLKVRGTGGYARINYIFGDVTLTSITAVEASNRFQPEDTDAEPYQLLELNYIAKSQEISQEFRAVGARAGWTWLAGLSYMHENLLDAQTGNVLLSLDSLVGPGAGDGTAEIAAVADNQTTNSTSAYVQTEMTLLDGLNLTLGGRYTYETKDFDAAGFLSVEGVNAPSGTFGPLAPTYHFFQHLNNAATSGRAALDYTVRPGLLAYASVTTGFKSGGFNGGLLDSDPAIAFQQLQPIQPETINSYEAGFKSDWLDNRLRLNGAGFYYQYHDLQIFNLVPAAANGGLPVNVLTNAHQATIKGIDAEAEWKPVPDLVLGATFGYLDTALGTFVNGAGTTAAVTYTGKQFPLAPHFSLTGSAAYDLRFANGDSLEFSTQASYRTRQFFDSSNDPLTTQAAYWLLDARTEYRIANGKWRVAVFAKNLTGTRYLNYALDLGSPFGLIQQVVGAPRLVGGEIAWRFH
jgi:iron complex outermembrane receptor protein